MRNLGGAIGLALIDSIIYGRSGTHAQQIVDRLRAGDVEAAKFIGLSLRAFAERPSGPPTEEMQAVLRPMIERAALTQAINEAWAMIALLTVAALICVPFTRRTRPDA
jgi:DHA2 family multidrug resistance protein